MLAPAVEKIINENLAMRPSRATEAGEHRWDAELDDLSPPALDAEIRRLRAALDHLAAAAVDEPSAVLPTRIDAATVRNSLEKDLFALTEEHEPQRNPLLYSQILGDAIHALLARPFAPLEKRLASVAARLRQLPAALAAARVNLADPPEIHVRTAAAQMRGLAELVTGDVTTAARGTSAENDVGPSAARAADELARFAAWLERDLLDRARPGGDDWRLGEPRFARKLVLAHDDPTVTPAGLCADARAAHARVRAEMAVLAGTLHGQVTSGCRHGGNDRELTQCVLDALAQQHAAPADLLTETRAICAELDQFLRKNRVVPMPAAKTAPLTIDWLPRFAAGVAVAMLYPPGPLEPPGQPSYYFIQQLADLSERDAASFLREYNRHMLVVLSIHEALPGHYVQLAWSNLCPSRARTIYLSGTFVEGWAKYTERMVLDAGFLADDPLRHAAVSLQQRKIQLRAITNTILDVEMHAGDLTEAGALELMVQDSFQEEREARAKYDRARLTSTQLTTYFAGDAALWKLRARAEQDMGASFSPYKFHERVLAHGSPSPRHLQALIA